MPSTAVVPDIDEQHRRLTIACALLDRAADHLDRLDRDRTLTNEQRANVAAALRLALIAREEIEVLA
jgi:hypothetical protein